MDHRKAVIDAILRRGWQPVVMEYFPASPLPSMQVCQKRVAESAAVVVLVAHRYGTPVPASEGGDGRHSYTWYEVEEAERGPERLFGYLVDRDYPWSKPKESDQLQSAEDQDAALAVFDRVKLVEELKRRLMRRAVGWFTTPEDLATKVITDLAQHAERHGATSSGRAPRTWAPRVAHALQPAPAFAGREALLAELARWWADPASPDRLCALVAPGGTGKTAVVERHLTTAGSPPGGGLFVWSFYEDPNVDHFLREAASYLLDRPVEGPGAVEALKEGLRGQLPHMLVLDGLERVQDEGHGARARGELQDTRLRTLVRLLAAGHLGSPRALITTRFPMRDLDDWRGRGYQAFALEDLEPMAARAVLRQWGVLGSDAALDRAAERLGRHALSVSVLGSYLARAHGGNPAAAEHLELQATASDDPASGRLLRLLLYYREALSPEERRVMGWLSTFPHGVEVTLLGALIDSGGEVAGELAGCEDARLVLLLQQLERAGLVFSSSESARPRWSAHPFLRDHFRALLGVPERQVWEVARQALGKGLEERPAKAPNDPATLDRYEALVEATRAAGLVQEAFDLYRRAMGGYYHLGRGVGDYARGWRITGSFVHTQTTDISTPGLSSNRARHVVGELGLFRGALGDLNMERLCTQAAIELSAPVDNQPDRVSVGYQNLSLVELNSGRLVAASLAASAALAAGISAHNNVEIGNSLTGVATCAGLRGDLCGARSALRELAEIEVESRLYSNLRIWEAEYHLALGHVASSRGRTLSRLTIARAQGWGRDIALCHDVLGRCDLPQDPTAAQRHLDTLRSWAIRSGEIEMILRTHRLAASLALARQDPTSALAEADEGLAVADTLGYRLFAIDLRVVAGRAALALPDPSRSLPYARAALDAACDPDCDYAWGQADAGHLCGQAHFALDELPQARARLSVALDLRRRIEHPGAEETAALLVRAGGPSPR